MATEGARLDAGAHGVPASGRAAVRRNAITIAPGHYDAAVLQTDRSVLSTEPQARKGPPAFKGRTALGADDLAKGDA